MTVREQTTAFTGETDIPQWLTLVQATETLGIELPRLKELIANGTIVVVRGSPNRVACDSLLAYRAERDAPWARANDALLALSVELDVDDEDALAALP